MQKGYRIKTNIGDTVLNVDLKQDYDFLEVLSLKLNQKETYSTQDCSYGIIVGRVLGNETFGIENAKVSVFVELTDEDSANNDILALYPYTDITSEDSEGRRYNLLPDSSSDDCYRIVGSFPNKRLVLDNDTVLEVYEKYWKYTTVTNHAGDYMICGVPTGYQKVHVDIDLSDIGIISQKPRDFYYKGYTSSQFENANQFKSSTNLDNLSQLYYQNTSVFVYPFWGNSSTIAITRCDVQIQYEFAPTCVFLGSIFTDSSSNYIGSDCVPTDKCGDASQLVCGSGTIETIRKTINGDIEELVVKGNQLIDGSGTWCYQIPMNLDFISTDEYGNIIPTKGSNKGIPTRASVRFRIGLDSSVSTSTGVHTAKFLVPNNPTIEESSSKPLHLSNDIDDYYEYGSGTTEECFRDLLWNNVYTVKSYIPRIQKDTSANTKKFTGIKSVNNKSNTNLTPPYNKLRISVNTAYRLQFATGIYELQQIASENHDFDDDYGNMMWTTSSDLFDDNDETYVFAPGTGTNDGKYQTALNNLWEKQSAKLSEIIDDKNHIIIDYDLCEHLLNIGLMKQYDVYNLDFYNDWLNGALYAPQWLWRRSSGTTSIMGIKKTLSTNQYCDCKKNYGKMYLADMGNVQYSNFDMDVVTSVDTNIHRTINHRQFQRGLIYKKTNSLNLDTYYYSAGCVNDDKTYTRLFSTDIVLLGSFVDNDLNGVPNVLTKIPPTTAVVPSVGPVEAYSEQPNEDGEFIYENIESDGDILSQRVGGYLLESGMDWGLSVPQSNYFFEYDKGLFGNVNYWKNKTVLKSAINAERLCELGVENDSRLKLDGAKSIYKSYTKSKTSSWKYLFSKLKPQNNKTVIELPLSGYTRADGMISDFEIDNNEDRAMFASLNYNKLKVVEGTKETTMTKYNTYKFNYMYPNNFDGRLKTSMEKYAQNRGETRVTDESGNTYTANTITHYDTKNEDYIAFRLGGKITEGTNKRHFYNTSGNISFPVYNNSFYFYFGIKTGNSAIERFNKDFYAECTKDTTDNNE